MKKLITTLLIAILAMIALTACGNDEPTSENNAPPAENVVEEEVSEPTIETPDNIDPETGYEICPETGFLIYPNARYFLHRGDVYSPIYYNSEYATVSDGVETRLFYIMDGDRYSIFEFEHLYMELPEIETPEIIEHQPYFTEQIGTVTTVNENNGITTLEITTNDGNNVTLILNESTFLFVGASTDYAEVGIFDYSVWERNGMVFIDIEIDGNLQRTNREGNIEDFIHLVDTVDEINVGDTISAWYPQNTSMNDIIIATAIGINLHEELFKLYEFRESEESRGVKIHTIKNTDFVIDTFSRYDSLSSDLISHDRTVMIDESILMEVFDEIISHGININLFGMFMAGGASDETPFIIFYSDTTIVNDSKPDTVELSIIPEFIVGLVS